MNGNRVSDVTCRRLILLFPIVVCNYLGTMHVICVVHIDPSQETKNPTSNLNNFMNPNPVKGKIPSLPNEMAHIASNSNFSNNMQAPKLLKGHKVISNSSRPTKPTYRSTSTIWK